MKLRTFCLIALIMAACGGGRGKAVTEPIAEDPAEERDFFVFDMEGTFTTDPTVAATFNELIDSVYYIPLETRKEALLPADWEFAKIGGDMFIGGGMPRNPRDVKPIFRFDATGCFVKQMTQHGRGPGELVVLYEWYVNALLKQIYVVDLANKIEIIPTEGGERSTIAFDWFAQNGWVPLNDSTFVSDILESHPDSTAYLFFNDRYGNLVHSMTRSDELADYSFSTSEYNQVPPYEIYRLYPDYKGYAIFQDIFNDTLYRVKSYREITPHLVFKRGGMSPRPQDKYNAERKRRQVYFFSLKESGNHIFLNYMYDDEHWTDVWAKRDGRLLMRSKGWLIFPFALPDGEVIDLRVVYTDKDAVYCALDAMDACKFMPNVKEDDNPVIVIARLKK